MCNVCKDLGYGSMKCLECECLVCFEAEWDDGSPARAYVTEEGELMCWECGLQADEKAERESWAEWFAMWSDAPDDLVDGYADLAA